MNSSEIKKKADKILYRYGLLHKLKEYGTPHVIGSYRMDMMAWNDLDIDIENDSMSLAKLYQLSEYILKAFRPSWYEAKEEITPDGKKVWFHGFEALIEEEMWNFDLWFFDKQTIKRAEEYCDQISQKATPVQKAQIIAIKKELLEKGMYASGQYTSMDIYKAVMEEHMESSIEFFGKIQENDLSFLKATPSRIMNNRPQPIKRKNPGKKHLAGTFHTFL